MRPVEKGDGAAYTAQIPADFNFSYYGTDKKALIKHYFDDKLVVTTTDCLNFWLQVVKTKIEAKKVADRTQDEKNRLIVKSMILDKVTDIYKKAGIPMVQTIGAFCCYCDTPIPGLLEVEHRCPKSQYPTFSMAWENFLVSCGPCNNTKRDNPDRATVSGWTTDSPITEEDYEADIKHHYVWADVDADPYKYIVPALYGKSNDDTWQEFLGEYAIGVNNMVVLYDLVNRVIKANLYAEGKPDVIDMEVRVALKKVSTGTRSQIIDLCGLNNPGNSDSTYDRRMLNRTKAWFTVLATIKPFTLIDFSGPQGQAMFDLLWQSLLITAASTGFFSVWFTILKTGNARDPSDVDLCKRFVLESNHPNLFPGTNTSLVNVG